MKGTWKGMIYTADHGIELDKKGEEHGKDA